MSVRQMMHDGWESERVRWEEATRAAHSVQDIGSAVAYLEDWIALDYAPGSDVCPFLFSMPSAHLDLLS